MIVLLLSCIKIAWDPWDGMGLADSSHGIKFSSHLISFGALLWIRRITIVSGIDGIRFSPLVLMAVYE
jgi:hypothetical protein